MDQEDEMEQPYTLAEALLDFSEAGETVEQAQLSFSLMEEGARVRALALAQQADKVDDLSELPRLARVAKFVEMAQSPASG